MFINREIIIQKQKLSRNLEVILLNFGKNGFRAELLGWHLERVFLRKDSSMTHGVKDFGKYSDQQYQLK